MLQIGALARDGTVAPPRILLPPLQFGMKFLDEGLDQFGLEQPLAQPLENAPLDFRGGHGPLIGTRALLAGGGAAIAVAEGNGDLSAAPAARDQAAEQALGPAMLIRRPPRDGGEAVLDALPKLFVDDGELGHRGLDPLAFVLQAGVASAAVGVAREGMAIEHLAADIERVGEHTDAPATVTMDARRVPGAAARRRDGVGVEPLGDRHCRGAGGELGKDTPHDSGMRRHDAALAAHQIAVRAEFLDHRVAISDAAGGEPGTRSAELTAQGFCRQVFEEQRIHGALETHVQLADRPLRQGDDIHLPRGEPLVETGDVLLVARQSI